MWLAAWGSASTCWPASDPCPLYGVPGRKPCFSRCFAISQGSVQKQIKASIDQRHAARLNAYSGKLEAQANALNAQSALSKKRAQNALILVGAAGAAILAVAYYLMRD